MNTDQKLRQEFDRLDSHEQQEFFAKLYLHQLQNLYFALTGEELNIQL